ncbi:hypothetical protein [Nevskia sp.]|uniref:hypothetical protein n=1 Tax=Nevskia sp. TaxID=1929292 RepID=UPI003F701656
MRRVNTFAFYTLGKELRPLENIDEDNASYGQVMFPLVNARIQVENLLKNEVVPLRLCRHAGEQFIAAVNAIVPADISEALKGNKEAKVTWWPIRQAREAASKFETVLAEELNILDTYSIAQKGAYSTSELIANAEVMFSLSVLAKLPALAVRDIREAGKCLAFETTTAAAFHILRAVEAVLLSYYEKILGAKPGARMRNWGVYIGTLRKSGKADEKILDFLDHIRNSYRNPVAHPEAVLGVEEVMVLLGVAVGAITQMALSL